MIAIRPATADDAVLLHAMLAVAVDWRHDLPRPAAEVLAVPRVAQYVAGWPRAGDVGFVAVDDGGPVGATWWRTFSRTDPGYGFVDEFTPEVSIGVVHAARSRGVGTKLLQALIEEAKRSARPALSLSVEATNPAASIYRRLGFEVVSDLGGSVTMALRLRS